MTEPLFRVLLLFLAGLVAGTLNVIAGGGSMLTLPLMIFLGLPPTVANGTNRVAIVIQNIGASWSFHRRGLISFPWLKLAIPPTLAGAVIGTVAAVRVGDEAFQRVLAIAMVVVTVWMLWRRKEPEGLGDTAPPTGLRRLGFAGIFFVVGLYGGFIQAGIGFLILATLTAGGLDLVRGNAMKVTLVLAFTPLALALFAWNGKVDWAMGFSLAAGNFLGALLGVRLQVLKGHRWVRGVVTVTIVLFAIRLLVAA